MRIDFSAKILFQMKTLTVTIEDDLTVKAIIAVLDALKLVYEIEDDNQFKDETESIMANPYLAEKITQGRKDMEKGKGTKIDLEDTWK